MRALTVRQPFAGLIVAGLKSIETRTWATGYRGPLLIHAAQQARILDGRFRARARSASQFTLPTGALVGQVDVVDCRPMTAADEDAAFIEAYEGAWAWVLVNPRAFPEVISARGRLRLWLPNAEVIEQVVSQLAR